MPEQDNTSTVNATEQTNGQTLQTPPAEPTTHERIDHFLGSLGTRVTSKNSSMSESLSHPPGEQQEQAATVAPQPSREVTDLQGKLAKAEKRYNDLQSDIDRRINVATRPLMDKLDGFISAMTAMQQQQPRSYQQPTEEMPYATGQGESVLTPAQLQYIDSLVQQRMSADPRIQAGSVISDNARFQQTIMSQGKDPNKYNYLMGKYFETFGVPQGNLHDHLVKLYNYWDNLAAGLATPPTEPLESQTPPPTALQFGNNGKVNADTAATLAAKAQSYQQERGQSASNPNKPVINYYGRLDTAIEQIADAYARKFGK